jgi:hypothetical protein
MTLADYITLSSYLGTLCFGAVVAGAIVFLFLKSFIPSYLSEKAKNLATKEDVDVITEKIEKVKGQYAENLQNLIHQNNLLLEELKGRQQLRLAAVDKRLQAHQEAFSLWRKLVSSVHSDTAWKVVLECQEWWNSNCIYLGQEARAAFNIAYSCASQHQDFLKDRSNPQLVKDNWKDIVGAGEAIVRSSELPSLGEKEANIIQSKSD